MKRFILAIVVLLLYFGCKTDSAREDLQKILSDYEPTTQIFKINSDSVVQFKGEKGTILTIDPSVLQHQDGSSVSEEIEVHLLELTSTEDLLRANAQTVSDGKWLISGGAYNIQIFSEDKELKIADGRKIEVGFPKIASEEMQLFDGNRDSEGNMNWKLLNQSLKNRSYPVNIQEDSVFYRFNREYQIDMVIDTIVFRRLKEKYLVSEVQEKFKEIDSLTVKNETIFAYIFSPSKLKREMLTDSLISPEEASELIKRKKITKKDIFAWEVYNTISISKLGWINVDRFYPEIKNRVRLEITSDMELDYAQLYAADAENNTLLNLYEDVKGVISFDAPQGKRFTIIAFGVKGDQTFGYKKSVLLEKDDKHQIKYRKVDRKKMEAYFKLN